MKPCPDSIPRSARAPMLALAFFTLSLPWMFGLGQKLPLPLHSLEAGAARPEAVSPGDEDGDGLEDLLEDRLLLRHAPTLLLAKDEPALPASIEWLRERVPFEEDGPRLLGVALPGRRFDAEIRRGSAETRDWTVYGHAFRALDGGVVLQYWYYFPYNEGPLFFDHESDWEHVTVYLDGAHQPVSVAYARHENNAPGVKRGWREIAREGTHPVVLVARGTHGAYARPDEAPFWEKLPAVQSDEAGRPTGDFSQAIVWRPGREGGARVVNVGERGAPTDDDGGFFLGYRGLWGATLLLGSAAPPGPAWQRGFCVAAALGACP